MEQPIKINKRIVLLLLFANLLYVLIGIAWLFQNINKPGIGSDKGAFYAYTMYNLPMYLGAVFFSILLLVGMLWLLRVFGEKKWVLSGIIVTFAARGFSVFVYMVVTVLVSIMHWNLPGIYELSKLTNQAGTVYLILTCLFVRNKTLRAGFVAFGILSALVFTSGYFNGMLRLNWYSNNSAKLSVLPFIASLALYIHIYNIAQKQKDDDAALFSPFR